jgi:thiol-disulfide isomerase/thioredoxin
MFRKIARAFGLLGVSFCVGCAPGGIGARGGKPQDVDLSKISVVTTAGETVHLREWAGHVIVIDFWATWCGPCRQELPELSALEKEYRDKGVKFLGIAVKSKKPDVDQFVQENNIEFPMTIGTPEIIEIFGGLEGIPTTFVFDKSGRVAAKFVGAREKSTFTQLFDKLLQQADAGAKKGEKDASDSAKTTEGAE